MVWVSGCLHWGLFIVLLLMLSTVSSAGSPEGCSEYLGCSSPWGYRCPGYVVSLSLPAPCGSVTGKLVVVEEARARAGRQAPGEATGGTRCSWFSRSQKCPTLSSQRWDAVGTCRGTHGQSRTSFRVSPKALLRRERPVSNTQSVSSGPSPAWQASSAAGPRRGGWVEREL